MSSANHIAFTAPINPTGVTPVLNSTQIWKMLQLKVRSAETFVPKAIQSTTVLSEETDKSTGNVTVTREVTFVEGERKVKEVVTAFEDTKVDFLQPDGSNISNVVSQGADGELYMTYVFEWRHPGVGGEELKALKVKEGKMAQMAVEGTIVAMRKLVEDGKY